MQVIRATKIKATPKKVRDIVSDIEHAGEIISGIQKIEVLKQPKGKTIVGLKWKETREFMGKDAIEVMWITDAKKQSFYETRAESHGSIYISRIELEPTSTGTKLAMVFNAEPVTVTAKILWILTTWMAKKTLSKTIDQDLADIQKAAEKNN